MNAVEYLKKIEHEFPVETILFQNIAIWPALRVPIVKKILENHNTFVGNKPVPINRTTVTLLIKSLFYGLKYLFLLPKFDIWAFSSSERRKKINNKYHDRVIDGISENFSKTIVFENPIPQGHINHKKLAYKTVVSDALFNLLIFFIYTICGIFKTYKLTNEEILVNILKKYEVPIKYKAIIKRFHGQMILSKLLITIKKPTLVFMANPSSYFGYTYTFKKNYIPVIELQHGILNENHAAYNYYKKIQRHLLPEYLFTYGPAFSKYFNSENYFINKNNVIPIGYYFMDLVKNTNEKDDKLLELLKKYETSIAFSSVSIEDIELPFLAEIAKINPNLLILFIPRRTLQSPSIVLPKNLVIWETTNIYRVIQLCDIHSTIVSTTAIEAVALKKPTIFYDFEYRGSNYYKELIDNRICYYAQTVEDFSLAITILKNNNVEENFKTANSFFSDGYSKKLLDAAYRILE